MDTMPTPEIMYQFAQGAQKDLTATKKTKEKKEGSALRPEIYTLCTIFERMLGIAPELLQLQSGVPPMSYTHLIFYPRFLQ